MASRHFSSAVFDNGCKRDGSIYAVMIAVLGLAMVLTGCATVRPEERGKLANPSMTFGSDGLVQAHEDHVFVNREGSYGGGTVTGGGCGCN